MIRSGMTREEKVAQFRAAGNSPDFKTKPDDLDLVLRCIDEEWNEFSEAAQDYAKEQTEETRKQLTKEWADLQYVVSQAACFFEIPADPAFNRVHGSNMTKVVDGRIIKREDGKILKPDTYKAPDMKGL